MTMHPGDHRANRRQLDMIISVKARPICQAQCVVAVRAAFCNTRNDPVRIGGKRPKHAETPLPLLRRAALGPVGLAPLRRRQRGVVGGLGWPTPLCLEVGNPPRQFRDLCRLRQRQRDQLFFG